MVNDDVSPELLVKTELYEFIDKCDTDVYDEYVPKLIKRDTSDSNYDDYDDNENGSSDSILDDEKGVPHNH